MKTKDHIPDQDFSREVNCTFKGKRYSVRDNGAVVCFVFEIWILFIICFLEFLPKKHEY